MGNDNSKSTIENQQMIMQLQQQLINQQTQQPQQHQYQQQNYQQHTPHTSNNNIYNRQLPVISPAELSNNIRNNRPPQQSQQYQQTLSTPGDTNNNTKNGTQKLLAILSNKELMNEIDKKPQQKRKLLEKILNEHRHMMTSSQVSRINQQLSTLPPSDNYSNSSLTNTKNYSNPTNTINTPSTIHFGFNEGTTAQDNSSRQLQRTEQLNTIDALTKHYKTEAEEEEARFKLEEERRRQEFAEKQRQRRQHYQASLSDLDKANIDALKLFNLDKNYTLDDLKASYKKLAMKTHPDKEGGNVEKFQLVTKCYMSLLEKYKNRETNKNFNDLRVGSKNYIEEQKGNNNVNKAFVNGGNGGSSGSNTTPKVEKDRFDAKLFNKIYEDNKLWESGDDGYGDWFKSEDADPPTEVFGNKFNLNVFNTTFENYKDKASKDNGAIQDYNEPQELVSCATGFTDIDIFAKKINDFSKALPTGNSKNDLAYTDLKTAYTSKGAFIDPSKVNYKTYNSIDDLKKDRSNVKYDMTPEQMRVYEMKKRREIEEEEKRQALIRQRDNVISTSYTKNHERMLGYRGNASY